MSKSQGLNIVKISLAIATSLLTSALIIGLRAKGVFESGELLVFDYLIRSNAETDPDSRLLLVAIDDRSLQKLNRDKISDSNLTKAIQNLQQHKPRVIGIDVLRDIPIGEGREELITYANNLYEPLEGQIKPVIFSCALPSEGREAGIAAPPVIDLDSAVGFVNLEPDKITKLGSEVIRRMPLSSIPITAAKSPQLNSSSTLKNIEEPLCDAPFSLGFLTALSYLQTEEIYIDTAQITEGNIGLGTVEYSALKPNAGSYHDLESGIYQIILEYRQEQPVEIISLADVLDNNINPQQVKNKAVLIGYTTKEDIHQTPFGIKPGVYLHGWTISQVLSNVLDNRPQIWYWSESTEWLWIAAWGLAGGAVALLLRPTWQTLAGGGVAAIIIFGSGALIFAQQGWIPLLPPMINLAIAATLVKLIIPRVPVTTKGSPESSPENIPSPSQPPHYSPIPTVMEGNNPTPPLNPTFVESAGNNPTPPLNPTFVESAGNNSTPPPNPTFVESAGNNSTPPLNPTFVEMESQTVDQSLSSSTQIQSDTVDSSLPPATHVEGRSDNSYNRKNFFLGKVISNRYRLDKLLGKGGMSQVFLASDTRLENKTVAVKIMTSYSGNNNEALIKRFNREVKVISSLRSHNIVQVTDFGMTPPEKPFMGAPFYVMEYFHGKTLGETLLQTPTLPVNRTIRIMLQVCTGLKEAHDKGIIHRDLKPDNIFLAAGGVFGEEAKILDFGIAKVVETEEKKQTAMTQHGSFIGTYRYASPEQCKGIPTIDRRTDVYSLGIILYEMLSGKNPYNSDVSQTTQGEWIACHIRAEAQNLSNYQECRDIPDSLKEITMKCLQKSPAARFQTIEELTQALKDINPGLF